MGEVKKIILSFSLAKNAKPVAKDGFSELLLL